MKIGRIVFKKSVVQKLGKKIIKGKKEQKALTIRASVGNGRP